jgi:phosphoglycerate dehydrogenase-like enzyme
VIAFLGSEPVDRETLLTKSDVITIYVSRTPDTRGMLRTGGFQTMKESA